MGHARPISQVFKLLVSKFQVKEHLKSLSRLLHKENLKSLSRLLHLQSIPDCLMSSCVVEGQALD